jgi:hypothetical protein
MASLYLPPTPEDGTEKELIERRRAAARGELSHGAHGALLVGGTAIFLLLLGWLLFYFGLFLRRGYVG